MEEKENKKHIDGRHFPLAIYQYFKTLCGMTGIWKRYRLWKYFIFSLVDWDFLISLLLVGSVSLLFDMCSKIERDCKSTFIFAYGFRGGRTELKITIMVRWEILIISFMHLKGRTPSRGYRLMCQLYNTNEILVYFFIMLLLTFPISIGKIQCR